jgi:Zn-dependent protease
VLLTNPAQFILNALYLIPALVIGIVVHEYAHAAVAVARGDRTPRLEGRLSLNPRDQLDPMGTFAVFLIYFGWGKPLRINPYRMRTALDPAIVWIAGPLASLLVAILLSFALRFLLSSGISPDFPAFQLLLVVFYFNVLLAIVNIIPIPGLDGYNLLSALFRRRFGKLFFQVDTNRQTVLGVVIVSLFVITAVLRHSALGFLYGPIAGLLLGVDLLPSGF